MFSASKTSGPSGYNINNSLRFRSSATANLTRTPASTTNRRTYTWSAWVKRGALPSSRMVLFIGDDGTIYTYCAFSSSNQLEFYHVPNTSGTEYKYVTSAVFRDPSAWYHVVFAIDTTQATAGNRVKIYVNGVQQTISVTTAYGDIPQNTDTFINTNNGHTSFGWNRGSSPFDGYGAEVNFIDGQALTPSSFGSTNATTGVWQPAKYTGSYGTNGFYLPFSDIATTSGSNAGLGKDFSGNSNYWTTNNISVTAGTTYDAMTDSPTLTSATVANYALLNPLQIGAYVTASNGNLTLTGNTSTNSAVATATISFASGKYYYEYTQGTAASETCGFALVPVTGSLLDGETFATNNAFGARAAGTTYGTAKIASSLTSWASGDVVGIAIDADNGAAYWSKNGVWQTSGVPTSGASKTGAVAGWTPTSSSIVTPFFGAYNNGFINVNFGQRPFAYTPPTGYVALNTYNLPTSTVVKGNSYMDATLWTGDGTSSRSITNAALFRPDFVWIKNRSRDGADPYYGVHMLFNTVTGAGNRLMSQSTTTEIYSASSLTAFNSNGFSVGSDLPVNRSGDSFVGWQWQAGQGSTSSNTSGSITSTVSVSTTAGFSIVTFTATGSNATVGHGLGVAPKMIITKQRNVTGSWATYHESLGNTKLIYLDSTGAALGPSSAYWNNTSPTSTVFTFGGALASNTNTIVAYCWAEIAGFSKFGSYTGNGSADGPFIYTGFRPKFILWKSSTDGVRNWSVFDSSRNTYNVTNSYLLPNLSNAEGTSDACDFLSNGFKWRSTDAGSNGSGQTFIYAAFAENPFKNALAR